MKKSFVAIFLAALFSMSNCVHAASLSESMQKILAEPANGGFMEMWDTSVATLRPENIARVSAEKFAAPVEPEPVEPPAEPKPEPEPAEPEPEPVDYEQLLCDAAPYNIPVEGDGFIHPYMDYKKITSRVSRQWAVVNSEDAHSDPTTGLRMVGNRYCIAIGQGYGMCAGDKVDVVLSDGSYIPCILGDMKAVLDTDEFMQYHLSDHDVVEMIVDDTVFYDTSQYLALFRGLPVVKLVKIEED